MSIAADVVDEAESLGATLGLTNGSIRVVAPAPLPDTLMSTLKAHKPEVIEHLQRQEKSTRHLACLCDIYTIRLRESCSACQGAVCGCGGCLRASRLWRYADREPPTSDLPLDRLLERLRKGSRWLQTEHDRCYTGELGDNTELAKMSATWDELEEVLRHTHGYQLCIFEDEGQRCPEDAPLRCSACATLTKAVKAEEGV